MQCTSGSGTLDMEDGVDVFNRMRTIGAPPEGAVGLPPDYSLEEEEEVDVDISHDDRKRRLIQHFHYLYKNSLVKWPKKNALQCSVYVNDPK